MTTKPAPKVIGSGLIALDMVMSQDPKAPIRSWTGGTCGNVLSILAYLGWSAYPVARMNGDPASQRVRADMSRWGVHLDFASCGPTAHTPIIVQEIRRGRDGAPKHKFSWACPKCGKWLPGFKAPTMNAVEAVSAKLSGTQVFFLDRVSRASLILAERAAADGAVVLFEPSGKGDEKLFAEAVRLAHVVKYAEQRFASVPGAMTAHAATLVEVQTLGDRGLRYRHRLGSSVSKWQHLNAVAAPRVLDSCGAGDWCTAGFIAKAAASGKSGLVAGGAAGVRAALRYGQTLAAWNVGFEGARGGMYVVSSKKVFDRQIESIAAGKTPATDVMAGLALVGDVACPACPPERARPPRATTVRKTARAPARKRAARRS